MNPVGNGITPDPVFRERPALEPPPHDPSTAGAPAVPSDAARPKRRTTAPFFASGILLSLASIVTVLTMTMVFQHTGATGLFTGALLAIAPVPLYMGVALWLDRYEREPVWMLAGAFMPAHSKGHPS